MRALESERPIIRATNTGSTAVTDYTGRVTHELARNTRGVLLGEVQGRNGVTPYARCTAKYRLWPLGLFSGLIVLIALGFRQPIKRLDNTNTVSVRRP